MSLAISFKGCCLNYFPLDNPSSQGLRIVPTMQNKSYNCRYLGLIYPHIVCLARFACTCNHFWHNNFLNLHYFHSGWLLSRVSHFQTYFPLQGKHSSSPTQASRFYHWEHLNKTIWEAHIADNWLSGCSASQNTATSTQHTNKVNNVLPLSLRGFQLPQNTLRGIFNFITTL